MTRETIQNVINSVLATSVVVLFVLLFTMGGKQSAASEAVNERPDVQASGELMPIATLSIDSIRAHYTFAVEANDKLMAQYEASVVKLDSKVKAFQKEYETFQKDVADFQRKVEAGAFISRDRAESEQKKLQDKEQQLMAKQQELENLRQQESDKFVAKQAELTQQFLDSIQSFLYEYNADGRYHIIIEQSVLLNKTANYDITNEVIDALNARYKK